MSFTYLKKRIIISCLSLDHLPFLTSARQLGQNCLAKRTGLKNVVFNVSQLEPLNG